MRQGWRCLDCGEAEEIPAIASDADSKAIADSSVEQRKHFAVNPTHFVVVGTIA